MLCLWCALYCIYSASSLKSKLLKKLWSGHFCLQSCSYKFIVANNIYRLIQSKHHKVPQKLQIGLLPYTPKILFCCHYFLPCCLRIVIQSPPALNYSLWYSQTVQKLATASKNTLAYTQKKEIQSEVLPALLAAWQ